jgi:hypothetical protein
MRVTNVSSCSKSYFEATGLSGLGAEGTCTGQFLLQASATESALESRIRHCSRPLLAVNNGDTAGSYRRACIWGELTYVCACACYNVRLICK